MAPKSRGVAFALQARSAARGEDSRLLLRGGGAGLRSGKREFSSLRSPRGVAFALQARLAAREKTHVFFYEFALRDCVAENVSFPFSEV